MTDANRGSRRHSALETVRQRYRDNGLAWTTLHVLSRGAGKAHDVFDRKARELESRRGTPGINTVERNREVWGTYDWSAKGEEWSESDEWREGVLDSFVTPHLKPGMTVIEIGPGAGRWTRELVKTAGKLILVDITETTLDMCREEFAGLDNVEYVLNDGSSLPASIPDGSVDFIWSFDVFVHIAPGDQRGYAKDFARVLKPGGVGVIHHGGQGGKHVGFRSAMTADMFRDMVVANGMTLRSQVDKWGPDGQFLPSIEGDVVSTFGRPPAAPPA